MKKLLCLMGGALLSSSGFTQKIDVKPYYIDDRISNIPLANMLNYKDTITHLADMGHKLFILDFWGIHCGSCIAMFPIEDSLQRIFKDQLQFILITPNLKSEVIDFINKWNKKHQVPFSLPTVTEGAFYEKLFWKYYSPHYVWISPRGEIIAQTSSTQINYATIKATIEAIHTQENKLKLHFGENHEELNIPKLTTQEKEYFKQFIKQYK